MASSDEREAAERAADAIDFRNLLLGAWPDGGGDEADAPAEAAPGSEAGDDPQWITWSDASAEAAWASGDAAVKLGTGATARSR